MAREQIRFNGELTAPPSRVWQTYLILEKLLCAAPATAVLAIFAVYLPGLVATAVMTWRFELLLYPLLWVGGGVGLMTLWSTLVNQRRHTHVADVVSSRQVVGLMLGLASAGVAVWMLMFAWARSDPTTLCAVAISLPAIPAVRTLIAYLRSQRG